MSAAPKEQVSFAFQTASEAESMDWLAKDQRERDTRSAVPAKSGLWDEHRVKHYPWWISFFHFLFGFSEPFLVLKICATLLLS